MEEGHTRERASENNNIFRNSKVVKVVGGKENSRELKSAAAIWREGMSMGKQ